jgi:tetratricopeptide (TPR) repeat protein
VSDSSDDATQAGSLGDEPTTRSRANVVEPGSVVGRHVVLQRLGAGGMGVVYAAYDPELDRKIALKLLLPGAGGETARLRLLREAQALGRLSHPNVVAIHDVGTIGEQVWLAMELVPGRTLSQWLETPRRWPKVLEVLRRAGEGLAAAHAAGLLHRDFKPDNVMVGDDGRVRVMDFGLARANLDALEIDSSPTMETSTALSSSVTRVGALVGTPSYMAPEQLGSNELSAAADQFTFCVTLWEALFGERPFGGDTPMELLANVLEGKLRPPARRRAVPGWLRRACERGLVIDPARRWPSMSALLDTLAKGRKRAAVRKGLLTVGVLALLGAGVEGQRRWDIARRTAACEATGNELDVAWNAEREQALHDALVATGLGYAPMTAEQVVPSLAQRAQAWRHARIEACLDADVQRRWDATTLDRSLWCLEERRMELESLVDELLLADAAVLQKAVGVAAGLSPVAACQNEEVLATLSPPPEDAREALRAVRADLVRAINLERAGRYDKGLSLARETLARAEALGWPPLVARARSQLGVLLERSGAYLEAETELERAYFDAAKGVAPEVVFQAATVLAYVVGVVAIRPAEGRRWARLADVALEHVPDGEHLHRASLLVNLAAVHAMAADFDEAKLLYEQACAIRERSLGPEHPELAQCLIKLAGVHYTTGAYDEAKALYERVLAIREQTLGPEHPDLAQSLNHLASLQYTTGAYDEAQVLHERALAIREKALDPEHPDLAESLNSLALVSHATGDHERALPLYERALAIWEVALGPEHTQLARTLDHVVDLHLDAGAPEAARPFLERALAIRETSLGPEHPELAKSLDRLATLHLDTGTLAEATALYERSLAIREKALGPEHPELAVALLGLAKIALAQQRPSDAVPLAERAVALREKAGVAADRQAKARFMLARALWDARTDDGRDRARAIALAEQARGAFRAAGKGQARPLAEVEAWLAAHASE